MSCLPALIAYALLLGLTFVPASGVRSADPVTLKIATLASDTGADVYYAQAQGFFKAAGLDVEINALGSGPAVISAVAAGSYDFGAANPVSIAEAHLHGIPILIVAPGAIHVKGIPDDGLMLPQASTIKTARDLEGKTIAVTTIGGLGALALRTWITKNGGDVKAVKFTEIPYPAMAAALEGGRFDGAVMTEPFITGAKPRVKPFIDAYDTIADRFLIDGWVSSEGWLGKHPDEARRFISAMRAAHEWANAHQPETAVILVKNTKIDPQIASTMARAQFGLALDPALVQPVLDLASKSGQFDRPLSAGDLIWKPK
jgi:NitT/TauT family transport system substrate-binding protein